jgi:hypothetical protein
MSSGEYQSVHQLWVTNDGITYSKGIFKTKYSSFLLAHLTPLLKIEISSNGQNCSILSQKVPKFELYKHNDELFNIYYRIFL